MWNAILRRAALVAVLGTGVASGQDEAAPAVDVAADGSPLPVAGWTVAPIPVLKQLWSAQATLNPSRDTVAFFSSDETIVYVQSSAGTVTAFNAESGQQYWATQVGRVDEVSLQAASNDEIVVIASGAAIHGLDKFTGQKHFSFRLPQPARGGPVLTNDSVFVPTGPGSLSAFRLETLNHLSRLDRLPEKTSTATDWRYGSGELLSYAPVAGRSRLAMATELGNVHAINLSGAEKGKAEFQFLMKSRATAPLTLATRDDREFLLAISASDRLFCIELQTNGVMRWTAPLGRSVSSPVVVVDRDVFVLADDGELLMLDLLTGVQREIESGLTGVINRSQQGDGEVPSFGATIELRLAGAPEFHPLQIVNRSTGHGLRSVTLDLKSAAADVKFVLNEESQPVVRVGGSSGKVGIKSFSVSEDHKELTVLFTQFARDEMIELYPELQHVSKLQRDITEADLDGVRLQATVTISNDDLTGLGQQIIGEMKLNRRPWRVPGIRSLASVSGNAVYVVEAGGRLAAWSRASATSLGAVDVGQYPLHISNALTDRVYLGTTAGEIACFAEARVELGAMPIPLNGLTWLLCPETELAPDFATFHQRPEDRPIMPDVPETDPAAPAVDAPANE